MDPTSPKARSCLAIGFGIFIILLVANLNNKRNPTSVSPVPSPVTTPTRAVSLAQKGKISELKSVLNKPLSVWIEKCGEGRSEQEGVWIWRFGHMEIRAFFVGENKLASFVVITVPYGQNQLTLEEAKQITASLGLKDPKKNHWDRLRTEWGKEGDPISADFDGNEGEHMLQITTNLFKLGEKR